MQRVRPTLCWCVTGPTRCILIPAMAASCIRKRRLLSAPIGIWSHMADPLHFGTFGGLTTKLIWFLFGLFLSGLSLTGGWLHLKRLEKAADGRVRWRGTILAAWMALAIFAFCIVAAIYVGIGANGVTIGTIAVSSVSIR